MASSRSIAAITCWSATPRSRPVSARRRPRFTSRAATPASPQPRRELLQQLGRVVEREERLRPLLAQHREDLGDLLAGRVELRPAPRRHEHGLRVVGRLEQVVDAAQRRAERRELRRVHDDAALLQHLPDAAGELQHVEPLQVLLGQPVDAAAVEVARPARQRPELEALRELAEQHRRVVERRARELGEVVQQGLGRVALAAQLGDRRCARALGELVRRPRRPAAPCGRSAAAAAPGRP